MKTNEQATQQDAGQARELPVLHNPDELEPAEFLASRLIDAWCEHHGKRIPWNKAIEISAIVTKMPAEEKAALLALDDAAQSAPAQPTVPDGWKLTTIAPPGREPLVFLYGAEDAEVAAELHKRLKGSKLEALGVIAAAAPVAQKGEKE